LAESGEFGSSLAGCSRLGEALLRLPVLRDRFDEGSELHDQVGEDAGEARATTV
jgi:hypothetical protein